MANIVVKKKSKLGGLTSEDFTPTGQAARVWTPRDHSHCQATATTDSTGPASHRGPRSVSPTRPPSLRGCIPDEVDVGPPGTYPPDNTHPEPGHQPPGPTIPLQPQVPGPQACSLGDRPSPRIRTQVCPPMQGIS